MSGRARLGRYAVWMAFDFVVERAASIVIILGLFLSLAQIALSQSPTSAELRMLGPLMMKNMLGMTWIMSGVLAVNGISSNDRATGRFRFLFSKPVRVDAYYAQAFAINVGLAAVCLLAGVWLLGVRTAASTSFIRDAMVIGACGVVGISGLCFLFSALWRFDWAATLGVWGVVSILHLTHPTASWLRFLAPMRVVDNQIGRLAESLPIENGALLGFVVFGLLCFTTGLVILRRRPLST